jgi:hypothetical protein
VGHPGRSNGSERRGGQLNRASVLGHVKQDEGLSRARPKGGNYGGALGKAKKLASTPVKPAKPKLPKEKSKAGTHVPHGAKPSEIRPP